MKKLAVMVLLGLVGVVPWFTLGRSDFSKVDEVLGAKGQMLEGPGWCVFPGAI